MKRKIGDRKDGTLLRNTDSMHLIMPLMYPNRCDNEAFISERIDLTNINRYLEKKNADNPDYAYNFFQIMVTAMLKTITLRPWMNCFKVQKKKSSTALPPALNRPCPRNTRSWSMMRNSPMRKSLTMTAIGCQV